MDQSYADLIQAAEQGNAEAQCKLGDYYAIGQDLEQAAYWWRKAAEQGNAKAQGKLGLYYATGEGVEQETEWWQKYDDLHNARCILNRYSYSTGIVRDNQQAIYWLQKAAEQENIVAQYCLGRCYEWGMGLESYAELNLSQRYEEVAKQRHMSKAMYWYRKAAEQGDLQALHTLGEYYYAGYSIGGLEMTHRFTPRELSYYWTKKFDELQDTIMHQRKTQGAERGNADDQLYLGICYLEGYRVEQDFKQAVYWLQKAAEQGVAEAQHYLGNCYTEGWGVSRDAAQAAYWYQKEAEPRAVVAKSVGDSEPAEPVGDSKSKKYRFFTEKRIYSAEERRLFAVGFSITLLVLLGGWFIARVITVGEDEDLWDVLAMLDLDDGFLLVGFCGIWGGLLCGYLCMKVAQKENQ